MPQHVCIIHYFTAADAHVLDMVVPQFVITWIFESETRCFIPVGHNHDISKSFPVWESISHMAEYVSIMLPAVTGNHSSHFRYQFMPHENDMMKINGRGPFEAHTVEQLPVMGPDLEMEKIPFPDPMPSLNILGLETETSQSCLDDIITHITTLTNLPVRDMTSIFTIENYPGDMAKVYDGKEVKVLRRTPANTNLCLVMAKLSGCPLRTALYIVWYMDDYVIIPDVCKPMIEQIFNRTLGQCHLCMGEPSLNICPRCCYSVGKKCIDNMTKNRIFRCPGCRYPILFEEV